MPIASIADDIVLAVNIPPARGGTPGTRAVQAHRARRHQSPRRGVSPTASKRANDGQVFSVIMPRLDRAAVNEDRREYSSLAIAIITPGILLSQPPIAIQAVHLLPTANRFDRVGDHFTPASQISSPACPLRYRRSRLSCRKPAASSLAPRAAPIAASASFSQTCVARRHRAVTVRDTDDWFRKIVIAESDGTQHRRFGARSTQAVVTLLILLRAIY